MSTHRVYLHSGSVIWPEHKPLEEVLQIKATSPEAVWHATYQGVPGKPGGRIFRAPWWQGRNRYNLDDRAIANQVYARFLSIDTGIKDEDPSGQLERDPSAFIVGELWPDYRLAIRYARTEYLEFPDLPSQIEAMARRWNYDEKLRAVIIEDKVSGTSALQTLRARSEDWLRAILVPFLPTTDKATKGGQAAVWCKEDCVLLPYPGEFWLVDLEDQLYDFPRAAHDDLVDAFSQMILYLEHYLEHGYKARKEQPT